MQWPSKLAFNDVDGVAVWGQDRKRPGWFMWLAQEDFEIMQFTEHQFEDNEAYDKDVIGITVGAPWNEDEPIAIKGIVEWENCGWWFKGIVSNEYDAPLSEYPEFVVLGNIYENPELVKS